MRRTREEAEATRRDILSAALEVFSEQGYSATRVNDIAARAEVTTGAIYHHFGGKAELYITLVKETEAKLNELAVEIVKEGGSPATILRRLMVLIFQYIEDDRAYQAVIELAINKTERLAELESFTSQALAGRRRMIQTFGSLIEQGIEAGEYRPDTSVQDAALGLVGFVNGVALIWIQDPSLFSIKDRAESLVDHFLEGISA